MPRESHVFNQSMGTVEGPWAFITWTHFQCGMSKSRLRQSFLCTSSPVLGRTIFRSKTMATNGLRTESCPGSWWGWAPRWLGYGIAPIRGCHHWKGNTAKLWWGQAFCRLPSNSWWSASSLVDVGLWSTPDPDMALSHALSIHLAIGYASCLG